MYGGNVRMIQRGQDLGLPLEPGQPLSILGESLRENLDGDFALQSGVLGPVHFTHTSFTELRGDLVVGDSLAYQLRLQTEGESIYRILDLWVWKGNLTRMVYILIRKIDGTILSYHTKVQLLPRRNEPLEFFKPVLNDDDFLARFSCRPTCFDHHKPLAVGGNVIGSEGAHVAVYVLALKELLGTAHNQFWLCLDLYGVK